jgi:hypothetical protein
MSGSHVQSSVRMVLPTVGNIITPSESLLMELALYAALVVIVACLFISRTMSGVKFFFKY